MKINRPAAFLAAGIAFLSFAACSKQASAATADKGAVSSTAQPASTPGPATDQAAAPATASANGATATPVSTAPRPWYADRLEKLGFYVFPAPVDVGDFTVASPNGGSMSLSKAKGKVVLLNFWATWCPPCRAEMPSIQKLWDKRKDKNFTVIAVSVGEQKDTVTKFVADNKYSYPIFLDPSGQLGSAFNASSIPTTYIIDKDGKVIAGTQGSREYDSPEVLAAFDELMAK
ncbi:MAG TPA: TlpA disulfide reductase family protein [Rectinemataceae bacterium]|nr:TlpA disulfide reductase family protein [Rectinemataceae bacterium]